MENPYRAMCVRMFGGRPVLHRVPAFGLTSIKVSVIIPVYNVEKYLRACLDSVVSQTLTDIEIICVDDGSTDGSPAILAEYAAKDPRVKVITQPKSNAGAARNAGMAVATGEYLGFVDADDWCELTLFEKAYAKAKAENADLVFWRYRPYDVRAERDGTAIVFPARLAGLADGFEAKELGDDLFSTFNPAPWNRLVRTTLVRGQRLEFQEIDRSNDVCFGCLVLATAKRIAIVDEPLYHYRIGMIGNLQETNDRTPLVVLKAWSAVKGALAERAQVDICRTSLGRAASNSIFYTLNTLKEKSSYSLFWHEVRRLYVEDPFFKGLSSKEVTNAQTMCYIDLIRSIDDVEDYLVKVSSYQRKLMARFYAERENLRMRCEKLEKERAMRESIERHKPSLRVIILGESEMEVTVARLRLCAQSLEDLQVTTLISPIPSEIDQVVATVQEDYVYFLYSARQFLSEYTLERMLYEKVFGHKDERISPVLRDCLENVVLKRTEFEPGMSEILSCPERLVLSDEAVALDERTRRRLYGVACSLDAQGVVPFCTKLYALIANAAKQLTDDESLDFLSAVLHASDYYHKREFFSDGDWTVLRPALDVLHNRAYRHVRLPEVSVSWKRIDDSDSPAVTYIVPVYNVESYLPRCLDSLRRQSLEKVEIICIDDGSTDGSAEILDEYARQDGRIKVVHKKNEGVGAARNLALSMARGKYVSFIDGDDWLDNQAARMTTQIADMECLDFCAYDITAFNHKTRARIPIYWSLETQASRSPIGKVVQMSDFRHLMIHASACLAIYRKSFLDSVGFRFSSLKLGEDLTFTMTLWPLAKRFFLLDKPFYHYRRGQDCSAVSNLTAGVASRAADEAQIKMMETLLKLYADVYKPNYDEHVQDLFRSRMLADILYYAEQSVAVRDWLREKGWSGFDFDRITAEDAGERGFFVRLEKMKAWLLERETSALVADFPALSDRFRHKVRKIEKLRECSAHDVYIITGQLNSTTNEPIDSWNLFQWMQNSGVPSRYVIWSRHPFCRELEAKGALKDVIVLEGDGVGDYEFVDRCRDLLVRARAVVQENAALNSEVRVWLKNLPECAYVFLQHGVFYTWFTPVAGKTLSLFNYVNVASDRERDFILARTPEEVGLGKKNFVIGGLPRWDAVVDASGSEKYVLVMLTWRMSLGISEARLVDSAYYQRLRRLLSKENVDRLAKSGVKVVLATHHHLAARIRELDFGSGLTIADTQAISKWIRKAKMLVTDFSSVSIDFLFQNKPTVFWMLDADDLLLDRANTDDGGKVMSAKQETAQLYNQVYSEEDVLSLVEHYAANGFELEPEKRAIAESFFANKKDVCRHVYESIEAAIKRDAGKGD